MFVWKGARSSGNIHFMSVLLIRWIALLARNDKYWQKILVQQSSYPCLSLWAVCFCFFSIWKHVCSSTEVHNPFVCNMVCCTLETSCLIARTFISIKSLACRMNLIIATLLLNIHRLECGSSYYLYSYVQEGNAHEEAKRSSMQNFTLMAVVCQCNFGSAQSPRYLEWREK